MKITVLKPSVESAINNGYYDSVEDYCNQNGCDYDDVYTEINVEDDD